MRFITLLMVLIISAAPVFAVCDSEKAQYDSALAAYNSNRDTNTQQIMSASYQRYILCIGSADIKPIEQAEPIAHYDCQGYDCANYGNKLDYVPTQDTPQEQDTPTPSDIEKYHETFDQMDDGDMVVVGQNTETSKDTEAALDFQLALANKLSKMLEEKERTGSVEPQTITDPNGNEVTIRYKDGMFYMDKDGNDLEPTEYIKQLEDEKTNQGTGLRTTSRKEELRKTTPEEYKKVMEIAGYEFPSKDYIPITSPSSTRVKEKLKLIATKGSVSQRERASKLISQIKPVSKRMSEQSADEILEKELPEVKEKIETKLREKDERILKGAGVFKRFVVWMAGKIPIVGDTAAEVYDKSLDVGIDTGRLFAERNRERDQIWREEFGY